MKELIEGYSDIDTGIQIQITRDDSFNGQPIRFSEINRVWGILLQELHKDDDVYRS